MEPHSDPAAIPRIKNKPRRSTLRFYGDEFVFDTVTGLFFRVSSTAGILLHAVESGSPVEDLPDLLQARYQLDRATATRDVELFLNDLAALRPLVRLNG